ncbi:hypothetical protein D3C76_1587140 [compost metagenome]
MREERGRLLLVPLAPEDKLVRRRGLVMNRIQHRGPMALIQPITELQQGSGKALGILL